MLSPFQGSNRTYCVVHRGYTPACVIIAPLGLGLCVSCNVAYSPTKSKIPGWCPGLGKELALQAVDCAYHVEMRIPPNS